MVANITNIPPEVTGDVSQLILQLGRLGLWLQAIGVIVIIWIVFYIIDYIYNRKKLKELMQIRKDIERLERKIDTLSKKK